MTTVKCLIGGLLFLFITQIVYAQQETLTEKEIKKPLNGVVAKRILQERKVLDYPSIREADLFWEKMIWRTIDVREKMNLPFSNPKQPFFLLDAVKNGEMTAYSTEDDEFSFPLEIETVEAIGYNTDTITNFSLNFSAPLRLFSNPTESPDCLNLHLKPYIKSKQQTEGCFLSSNSKRFRFFDKSRNFL